MILLCMVYSKKQTLPFVIAFSESGENFSAGKNFPLGASVYYKAPQKPWRKHRPYFLVLEARSLAAFSSRRKGTKRSREKHLPDSFIQKNTPQT